MSAWEVHVIPMRIVRIPTDHIHVFVTSAIQEMERPAQVLVYSSHTVDRGNILACTEWSKSLLISIYNVYFMYILK